MCLVCDNILIRLVELIVVLNGSVVMMLIGSLFGV